ncbi:MAG TPA: CCE_0567 family metalloprotein [Gammaproteobacteria bacterium]
MTDEEIKNLDKEVKRLKRIASEWASQLHDLVEDRLPGSYAELPAMVESTYAACKSWAEANHALQQAQNRKQDEGV